MTDPALRMLLYEHLELIGIRARELRDHLAVLDEMERRYGLYAGLDAGVGEHVDVGLEEDDVLVLVAERLVDGRDLLARLAPLRAPVDDHELLAGPADRRTKLRVVTHGENRHRATQRSGGDGGDAREGSDERRAEGRSGDARNGAKHDDGRNERATADWN